MASQQRQGNMLPMETAEYNNTSQRTKHRIRACFSTRTTNKEFLPAWRVRLGLFLFAILQNGLLGGVLFGWPSIDQSLLSASIENGGAGLNLHDNALIFSWASSLAMFSPFLLGNVLDSYGPRVCSILSCCIMAFGALLFATSRHFIGFAIASCLMSFGGPGIVLAIIHISNLFPGHENLIMASLSGSVATSFAVFAVFDVLWNRWQVTVHGLFTSYAIIIILLALGALWLYPDEPFEEFETDDADVREEEQSVRGFSDSPKTVLQNIPETERLLVVSAESTTRTGHNHHSSHHVPTTRTGHNHHSSHHVQSVMSNASFHIEQPLDSYLRDGRKMYRKTESFVAAKKALTSHNEELATAVGLKDQPFIKQLGSASYLRATFFFLVTSFATNFYVASISTELADLQYYDADVQHQLTRSFTVIMAMGAFVSVFVGWLIDQIGVEACMAMTLIFGQMQMLILLFFGSNIGWFKASFGVYTFFRQFLYPVYIASLTTRLGFKYFGVLLGIGFGVGGVAQLFLSALDEAVQGDCHLSNDTSLEEPDCNQGLWVQLHVIQILVLVVLLVAPFQDHRVKKLREKKIKDVLSGSLSTTYYGADSTYVFH
jgi:MFS family permease